MSWKAISIQLVTSNPFSFSASAGLVDSEEIPTAATERGFMCDIGTGTATLSVKYEGATDYIVVHTFAADEAITVDMRQGYYKVDTTGDAVVIES